MRAVTVFLSVTLGVAALVPIAHALGPTGREAGGIWCKAPTTVTVGQRSVSTPEICVPGP